MQCCSLHEGINAKWARKADDPVFDLCLKMPELQNLLVGRSCLNTLLRKRVLKQVVAN